MTKTVDNHVTVADRNLDKEENKTKKDKLKKDF